MAATSIKQVQHKQRPDPAEIRAVDFRNEQERLCRQAKNIISSWFQGQKIFNVELEFRTLLYQVILIVTCFLF